MNKEEQRKEEVLGAIKIIEGICLAAHISIYGEGVAFHDNATDKLYVLKGLEEGRNDKDVSKRKEYRTCPICGKRQEQSEMIRTDISRTGWLCAECYEAWCNEHLEPETGNMW